jgi:hypothetical protein
MNPKRVVGSALEIMRTKLLLAVVAVSVLLGSIRPATAQWQSQSFVLKPGWTAIYLHVDPSYTNLDHLVGSDPNNPISEIWMWVPGASTIQYVTSPQQPTTGSSQWSSWVRGGELGTSLVSMIPNAAYLVHSLATTNYTWSLKGKPATPVYTWTTTGINFVGFPTPVTNPPLLDAFLSLVPNLQGVADAFQYLGGDLGPMNPSEVFAPHTVPVTRGKAFWIRSGSYYNTYFGPFTVVLGQGGIAFGDSTSQSSFHLQNTTPSTVTVRLTLLPSESPPTGQAPIAGLPPLVVRGVLNSSNLTYSATNLTSTSTLSWTLTPQGQPGSDIVITLGLNRPAFSGSPSGFYAGILKFTDSFNYTEVDVPVSAQPSTYSGLWVGSAAVSQVANYLKIYQLDQNNHPILGSNGAYMVTDIITNLGLTSSAFPLRLIVHNDGTNVSLLQRVFFGSDPYSNNIVSTSESYLDPAQRGQARRITAVQLPFTAANQPWLFSGQLVPGGTLGTTVNLPYDDQASNPFLHTYHPDHDNLDATFQHELPIGSESYGISRQITLSLNAPGNDFASLTQFGQAFQGAYTETITMTGLGNATRTFNVAGAFALSRISSISVLTHP